MASEDLSLSPGTYILILSLSQDRRLVIGMLGEQLFLAGHYAYVGSAHGSGGLAGRIGRHLRLREEKPLHWHIDYFLQAAEICQVWWVESEEKLECVWALSLRSSGFIRIPDFGATDCRCGGHLLWLGEQQRIRKAWSCLQSEAKHRINQMQVHPTINGNEG
jgi:sugar fermentation stimulation protein A